MAESMEDILNPPETPAPVTEAPPEPVVERATSRKKEWADKEQAAQGRVRDPNTGQYSTKVEPEPTPEPVKEAPKPVQQDMTDKEKAFLRTAQEERYKRQELEKRLAALEAAKPAEPVKTFWDDPEAALKRQQEEIKAERDSIRNETLTARLQTSEFIARKAHPDFDEKVDVFGELLKETPGLHAQWLADPDPAEFAYKAAKSHIDLKEAGSIDGLREKIEKEVRLKIEAELNEKAAKLAAERAALPPSLSDARSKGNHKTVWSGAPSMDSILKG